MFCFRTLFWMPQNSGQFGLGEHLSMFCIWECFLVRHDLKCSVWKHHLGRPWTVGSLDWANICLCFVFKNVFFSGVISNILYENIILDAPEQWAVWIGRTFVNVLYFQAWSQIFSTKTSSWTPLNSGQYGLVLPSSLWAVLFVIHILAGW